MSTLPLRQLTDEQRARAFINEGTARKQALFRDTVREMEGGIAYAIATNGMTARGIRTNMNRAARDLGLKLHWAKIPKDAAEVVVELDDAEDRPVHAARNPTLRPPR